MSEQRTCIFNSDTQTLRFFFPSLHGFYGLLGAPFLEMRFAR